MDRAGFGIARRKVLLKVGSLSTGYRLPTYFISHGGGPWPWLDGPYREACAQLEASLKALPGQLPGKPVAVLVVSAHWEEPEIAVMANPAPSMIYDYRGFPEHTYRIQYPAPGSPPLAARIQSLLASAGIPSRSDPDRGFDHGMYAPFVVAYPDADMPIVQVSLRHDYDPEFHLQVGQALAPLRDEGVLIVGSGLTYHNLRLFDARAAKPSREFDAWLQRAVVESVSASRSSLLLDWEAAPSARIAHPQEDHLLPLMVAVGAAEEERGQMVYHEEDFMGGVCASSFRFG